MTEVYWTGLPGFPRYEVSTDGRIVNLDTGRTLSPSIDPRTGTYKVTLTIGPGRYRTLLVHRLVAEAWLDEYEEGLQVVFIDEDPSNWAVDNLKIINRGVRGPNRVSTIGQLSLGR